MKFVYAVLLGCAAAIRTQGGDDAWGDMLEATDKSDYIGDTPKDYTEKPKPKIDYKKLELEHKAEQALAEKEEAAVKEVEQDLEDMDIELYTFSKTLKPSAMHKALAIKEKLETAGKPAKHFRVSLANMWSHGFKHEAVSNYAFVKEKLQDLDVAEKNLNRNIDSKAQLELFLGVASDVRSQFKKRYGDKEWNP